MQAADPRPADVPYTPAGHAVQPVEPAVLYCPAAHCPPQAAVEDPAAAPYVPAGQGEHDPAPATLYCPAGHMDAVALVLPAGQAYPAVQLPLHADDVNPPVAPYVPPGHWTHATAPARLYCPAAHAPLQAEVVSREVDPNCPAGHCNTTTQEHKSIASAHDGSQQTPQQKGTPPTASLPPSLPAFIPGCRFRRLLRCTARHHTALRWVRQSLPGKSTLPGKGQHTHWTSFQGPRTDQDHRPHYMPWR